MFSRISVILLPILLGCRQHSNWTRAFGRDSLHLSHRLLQTRLSAKLETPEREEAETKASRDELMDESVLLYSIVSQRTKFGEHTEAELDVLNFRGKELVAVFEDVVFDSKGIVREGITSETLVPETIV